MTSPIVKLTADKIAKTYPIEDMVAVVEFHNGNMIIADCEDLAEHGEAFSIGLPGKKFPPSMKHADRVEYMRHSYLKGF